MNPLIRIFSATGLFLGAFPNSAVAAGGELPSLVKDIAYCIVFAGVLAILFTRLRIPVIAAFLAAGIIVGPTGGELVTDPANIETISQLGLILLLFMIGLEIDVRKLLSSGRILIVSGLLQYPLCVVFGILITRLLIWLGIGTDLLTTSSHVPLYVGFVIAASSTLLVIKLFQDSFQLDTETGRIALGLLIFQDIWAIVVIAIQPSFSDPRISTILLTFLGIGIIGLITWLLARLAIPVGFKWVAKMPEIILIAAVSWCFITVILGMNIDLVTETVFGFNLHLAVSAGMCALIAGMSIASLPYSIEIISKVGVVKDFFVTLFFVGLGMSIPMPESADVLIIASLLAVATLLARYIIFFPLLYFSGLDRRNSMVASTRLAQVSEFSLVIGFLGMQLDHISRDLNSAIIFAFVITALLTPALFRSADSLYDNLCNILDRLGFKAPAHAPHTGKEFRGLALLGFHRVASSLLYEIGKNHPELLNDILVVDFNVNIHEKIESHGPTVRYGDLGNTETLIHAGVDKARVIVCTIPDDVLKSTTNRKIVETARSINPDAIIIANASESKESKALYDSGADYVYLPHIETARAVEYAIEKALDGNIAEYRSSIEKKEGAWHNREEVL